MKRKLIIALLGSAALVVAALFWRLLPSSDLPRLPLQAREGGEFRVIQISYTTRPCNSTEHNLGAAKGRLWLYRHLPAALRQRVPEPPHGIGDLSSTRPVLSIWWAHFDATTGEPRLGETGDVLMTVDSGQQTNLGWSEPAEDYRQIFITDPPTNSKRLTFEFPIWGERVRFSIANPSYRE